MVRASGHTNDFKKLYFLCLGGAQLWKLRARKQDLLVGWQYHVTWWSVGSGVFVMPLHWRPHLRGVNSPCHHIYKHIMTSRLRMTKKFTLISYSVQATNGRQMYVNNSATAFRLHYNMWRRIEPLKIIRNVSFYPFVYCLTSFWITKGRISSEGYLSGLHTRTYVFIHFKLFKIYW